MASTVSIGAASHHPAVHQYQGAGRGSDSVANREVPSNARSAALRTDPQPRRRHHTTRHRGEEPEDAQRVVVRADRVQRAARPRIGRRGHVSAVEGRLSSARAIVRGSQASVTPPAPTSPTADSSHDRTHQSNPAPGPTGEGAGQRRRRRRRRGRRGGGPPAAFGAPVPAATSDRPDSTNPQMRPAESPAAENHGDDDGESEGDDGGSDIEPQ